MFASDARPPADRMSVLLTRNSGTLPRSGASGGLDITRKKRLLSRARARLEAGEARMLAATIISQARQQRRRLLRARAYEEAVALLDLQLAEETDSPSCVHEISFPRKPRALRCKRAAVFKQRLSAGHETCLQPRRVRR